MELFKCCICGKDMELIIEEIQDTGCAWFCYNCGVVLETVGKFDQNEITFKTSNHRQEIKEWFIPNRFGGRDETIK